MSSLSVAWLIGYPTLKQQPIITIKRCSGTPVPPARDIHCFLVPDRKFHPVFGEPGLRTFQLEETLLWFQQDQLCQACHQDPGL